MSIRDNVVLLVGGVGGAKLALGLYHVLPPENLTIIVNTADDFEHLGLHVSPDLDTVMYTLAGLSNSQFGWGVEGDTRKALEMLQRYGAPSWFGLGDADLGTNIFRTNELRLGHSHTEVTQHMAQSLGIKTTILPMSDDPVRTRLNTEQGTLGFQEYFVKEQWKPVVKEIVFDGADQAKPSHEVAKALERASFIVFGPSNPFLSIDPILSIKDIFGAIETSSAPCVAVSPIVGGEAIKGPAAKLMKELRHDVSPMGIIDHYEDLLNGFILDNVDEALCEEVEYRNILCTAQQTVMHSLKDKIHLAQALLHWTEEKLL